MIVYFRIDYSNISDQNERWKIKLTTQLVIDVLTVEFFWASIMKQEIATQNEFVVSEQ